MERHSNEPATLLNERTNQKIQIFNYVVGMKRCINLLKSASHSATLSFQPTLTEKKSLVNKRIIKMFYFAFPPTFIIISLLLSLQALDVRLGAE